MRTAGRSVDMEGKLGQAPPRVKQRRMGEVGLGGGKLGRKIGVKRGARQLTRLERGRIKDMKQA